jgi:hypothetical protein
VEDGVARVAKLDLLSDRRNQHSEVDHPVPPRRLASTMLTLRQSRQVEPAHQLHPPRTRHAPVSPLHSAELDPELVILDDWCDDNAHARMVRLAPMRPTSYTLSIHAGKSLQPWPRAAGSGSARESMPDAVSRPLAGASIVAGVNALSAPTGDPDVSVVRHRHSSLPSPRRDGGTRRSPARQSPGCRGGRDAHRRGRCAALHEGSAAP